MAHKPAAPRRDQFPAEYLIDLNATAAAIRCGYSPKSAEKQGARLTGDAKVAAEIQRLMALRAKRVEVKSDDILRELLNHLDIDVAEVFNEAGELRAIRDIPERLRRCIAGIDVVKSREGVGSVVKIRFNDKLRAAELLGKHLKLFTEVHEVQFASGLADRMKAAEARALRRGAK